jgi:DNA-binding XRE family transcriptional regulator
MAFNYNKLRGKIIEKFGTQGRFAKVLGVSERTLSLKLNNKIFFTQDEISKSSELLSIDSDKIQVYFFEKEVQNIELII